MDFLNGSFQIGRLFDINIRIHILFVIWIAWRLIMAGQDWVVDAAFLGMLFGIVLLHEFGHCFGARSVGGDAENIMMWPLGGLAYAHAPMRPWPQFVTVACGPLVNVVFCVITAIILLVFAGNSVVFSWNPLRGGVGFAGPVEPWLVYLAIFYHVNYWLLAFNLLPIYPLDGGQLFHTLLWPQFGLRRATEIACWVGIAGCVMLAVWGLSGAGGILIFIALFGGMTCWQRLQMAQYGMLVEDPVYENYNPTSRAGWRAWFGRLFKMRGGGGRVRRPIEHPGGRPSRNPNPGAWQARREEQVQAEAELDRILKKVSDQGIQSLSYTERQVLERATRARQAEERSFERKSRM